MTSVVCSIMQPTYLPWAGYFRLIGRSNIFIFLDDAQYERGTWHQRNRILTNGQPKWITVPVRRGSLGQSIRDVIVDDTYPWRKKHLEMVRHSYGKHSHYGDIVKVLGPIGDTRLTSLADLNIALIMQCCNRLGLDGIRYVRSSSLGIAGMRTDRIIALCESSGAKEYLSPRGSKNYLEEDQFSERTAIKLGFDDFDPASYEQPGASAFVSHLSILDVVANFGWDGARSYLFLEDK